MGNNYAKLKSRQDLPTLFRKTLNRIEELESREVYSEKFDTTIDIYETKVLTDSEEINHGEVGASTVYGEVTDLSRLQKSKGKIYTNGVDTIYGVNSQFYNISNNEASYIVFYIGEQIYQTTSFTVISNTEISCSFSIAFPTISINDVTDLFYASNINRYIYGIILDIIDSPASIGVGSQIFQPMTYAGTQYENFPYVVYDEENKIMNHIIGLNGAHPDDDEIFGQTPTLTPNTLYGMSSVIKKTTYDGRLYLFFNKPILPTGSIFYQNTYLEV